MSSLLFQHLESGRSLFINGRGYNVPALMNKLPVTSYEHGKRPLQRIFLEKIRDTSGLGILFKIPHPCIFLLSTVSMGTELFVSRPPVSYADLPDVLGEPTKSGIIVWAKPDIGRITIFDSESELNLTEPKQIYSLGDITITPR